MFMGKRMNVTKKGTVMWRKKLKVCNQKKVNVIFMNDYLVKATWMIDAGDEIKKSYDWYLTK